jgi:hypothetical protein
MHHYRTNVIPPYTEDEIAKIRLGLFVGLKFFQDNGLLRKTFVRAPEDIETMENPMAKDFTGDGLFLYRTSHEKFLAAIGRNFNKDPHGTRTRILERDLRRLRDGTLPDAPK